MYSNFNWEDIEVTDWKGLKEYLELFKKVNKDENTDGKGGGWNEWFNTIIPKMIGEKSQSFSFECWTELKIISYWYSPYLIFFDGLAKYIEGEVHWSFENEDEAGYVSFRDGECMINTGQMEWQEWTPVSGIEGRHGITEEMKKLLLLNKLDAK